MPYVSKKQLRGRFSHGKRRPVGTYGETKWNVVLTSGQLDPKLEKNIAFLEKM